MTRKQARNYLKNSGYTEDQIEEIIKPFKEGGEEMPVKRDPEKVSGILVPLYSLEAMEDARNAINRLFDSVPADNEYDLFLLSTALTDLNFIIKNIEQYENGEGFSWVYNLKG